MDLITKKDKNMIGHRQIEWNLLRLENIVEKIGSGATPTGGKESYKEHGISLIRSQNVYNNRFDLNGLAYIDDNQAEKLKYVSVEKNDVLLNITGDSVARCCMVPNYVLPARVNQHVSIIRTKKDILNPHFLLYHLVSPYMQENMLSQSGSGATRNALTKGMIENFEIAIPPLPEQKAIADILSSLDDKIELNNRMNKTLEEMARAIFKRWFVEFEFPLDSARGKPSSHSGHESRRLLSGAEASSYKASGGKMVESELGMIPDGWEVKNSIFEICKEVKYGFTQSASDENVGPKFLRVTDINKGDWINWSTVPYCNIDDKNYSKYKLEKYDIVVARMADPGKLAIFEDGVDSVFASYLIRIRLKDIKNSYYLYYLMKSDHYQNYILGAADGSVMKNLNAQRLTKGLKIYLPNENVLNKFNILIETIRIKIFNNIVESNTLSALRDSLLPKLMSGDLRVPPEKIHEYETEISRI